MAAIQLNFTLRTSAHCKTVHLLGSWDNYNGQLPLSKDPAKSGGWKGAFRFPSSTLKQGQRYWYYYIIDGYHVSHDPARPSVVEPTTKRTLNTLDIPSANKKSSTSSGGTAPASTTRTHRHSRRISDVPKGRSLSPSQIKCPKPQRDYLSQALRSGKLNGVTVEQLAARLAQMSAKDNNDDSSEEEEEEDETDSDIDSDVPSLTSSRSSNTSSPSSASDLSSCCTCERYGITRAGSRVKLDCGGSRCGGSDNSECSSESEDDKYVVRSTRRQGIVMRA